MLLKNGQEWGTQYGRILGTLRRKEVKTMAIDPVCGMEVDEDQAAAQYEYKGETYYFCAVGCKDRFAQNPEQFVKEEEQ